LTLQELPTSKERKDFVLNRFSNRQEIRHYNLVQLQSLPQRKLRARPLSAMGTRARDEPQVANKTDDIGNGRDEITGLTRLKRKESSSDRPPLVAVSDE